MTTRPGTSDEGNEFPPSTGPGQAIQAVVDDGGQLQGPWQQAFWVSLPMAIKSKSNFRRGSAGQNRGEWTRQRNFSDDVSVLVRAQLPDGWDMGSRDKAVATRPKVVFVVFARSMLDAGNFSKSLLDACEGVVYINDASVVHPGAFSERSRTDQHAIIGFARLACDAEISEVVTAANELSRQMVGIFSA